MMKIAVICLLVISQSSCISFYDTSIRDSDRCIYSIVNPETGSVLEAIEANEENWAINEPECTRIFDNLGL